MNFRSGFLPVLLSLVVQSCLAARSTPGEKAIFSTIDTEIVGVTYDVKVSDEPTHEEQECLRFFGRNMPVADRMALRYTFLHNQVHLALKARADNPWAMAVPFDIFLNNVLPYANLDEPREDWRSSFYELFSPLVAATGSTLEAAEALNAAIWTLGSWNITFKSEQTPDIMAPSQVIAHGFASCTGLAIFLVDACRAVGIPARVAGIAEWPETGGNHNWVEVWHDGVWSFTDPIGFVGRPWNATWFFPQPVGNAKPHSYAHGVFAASFKHTGHRFPLAWHDEYESSIPAYEVTPYYITAAAAAEGAVNAIVDVPDAEGGLAGSGSVGAGVGPEVRELARDVARQ